MPDPATAQGEHIFLLWRWAWIAALATGAVVWGLIFYACWRYHRRSDDEVPVQTRYNLPLEIFYTIAPIVMVVVFFVHTERTQNLIREDVPNPDVTIYVVGQQWTWTYRYPQFGGMESSELMLPVNTPVTFHVTSLDVIHSFWAYQLGVKADANPQVDNVAYVTPKTLGSVTVRCNELCGIWHGAMFNYGHVVSPTAFQTWASGVQAKEQSDGVLAALPPYALTYDPTVVPQLGKNLPKIDGITGAAGYYYPPSDPVTP